MSRPVNDMKLDEMNLIGQGKPPRKIVAFDAADFSIRADIGWIPVFCSGISDEKTGHRERVCCKKACGKADEAFRDGPRF